MDFYFNNNYENDNTITIGAIFDVSSTDEQPYFYQHEFGQQQQLEVQQPDSLNFSVVLDENSNDSSVLNDLYFLNNQYALPSNISNSSDAIIDEQKPLLTSGASFLFDAPLDFAALPEVKLEPLNEPWAAQPVADEQEAVMAAIAATAVQETTADVKPTTMLGKRVAEPRFP